jgi:hypothetical protein
MEGCTLGQILHGCATTTEAIRRAIQHSQASLRALARRYGINPKTVAKWRQRSSVADLPTGPKNPKSTVLSVEEEAIVIAFRRHTLLPLDDCLYPLQPTIPNLTRSSLHRCLQHHGISRLPQVEGDKPDKRKFKSLSDRLLRIRPVWTALPGTAGMTDASMFDWGGDEGKCPQTRLWTQTSSDDGIGRGRRL